MHLLRPLSVPYPHFFTGIPTMSDEILIIEDSATQAEQLKYILESHGFLVTTAANGRVALDVMAVRRPSFIISDIIMPEMDGYELCRRIKSDERFWDIPIILLTSLADPHDVIRGLECGADNFITKPYDRDYLLSRIRHMQINRLQPKHCSSAEGIQVHLDGHDYVITADRQQIINLLLSTYETAILKNRELVKARDDLSEANDLLNTANQELEAFSYTVSHDLRTPLTCIGAYSQLLKRESAECLGEASKGYINGIYAMTNRMDKLITTLLQFSQVSRKELHREQVNLSKITQVIGLELQLNQPERKVSLTIKTGVMAEGDAKLLTVVLQNLIGNAWKYTGQREHADIEFGMNVRGERLEYFVRDNGAGFSMEEAHRLFAAFQRLHSAEEFEGTGIGLATVQRIIKRHGGEVWAEGEVEKGATFYFTLE